MIWKSVPSASKAEIAEFNRVHRKKARFLVDESAGIEVASQMKELGWNVKFVDDVGLKGRGDENVFAFARKENRVILTHDDDFMDNRQFPINLSPGVVIIPGGSGDEEALGKAVAQVIVMFGWIGDFFKKTKISITHEGVWTIYKFNQKMGRIDKTRYKFPKNGDTMEWVET